MRLALLAEFTNLHLGATGGNSYFALETFVRNPILTYDLDAVYLEIVAQKKFAYVAVTVLK
jgi:hypothetical protein